jgi:hypothetical protein
MQVKDDKGQMWKRSKKGRPGVCSVHMMLSDTYFCHQAVEYGGSCHPVEARKLWQLRVAKEAIEARELTSIPLPPTPITILTFLCSQCL